ncbi:MAG: glycosyltransferase family 4 protein [Anaerolineae bacterium]|nr:glycosyltransferase family 4 protein [Anaerolineae bacterium]
MKILHVVHGYPPSMGGSQWLIKNLSEQLVKDYNDDVTVFTTVAYQMEYFWKGTGPTMPAGTEVTNGVTVRRFPVYTRFNTLRRVLAGIAYRLKLPYNDWLRTFYTGPIMPGLKRAIANSGADIILAATFPLLHMYDAAAAARKANIPLVLLGAIHTAEPWGYERKMIYKTIQRADAYIALTDFEREYVIERGIAPEKVYVTGGGVDIEAFLNSEDFGMRARCPRSIMRDVDVEPVLNSNEDIGIIRERYGWGNAPVVITLGKQTARKRFEVLLKAMPYVWRRYPRTQLLLAGAEGPETPKLREIIAGFSQEQQAHITIVSDFPDEEKPHLLAAGDLFVLPSGEESFGIAFVEAWACGKPVIGSRTGAIPSVIDEGQDGLLAAYEDVESYAHAIMELLENPQRSKEMGKAGRQKVLERYTWPVIARKTREIYEQVQRT